MNPLSELCRTALKDYLGGNATRSPNTYPNYFVPTNFGMFVSLYNEDTQRGCLGLNIPITSVADTAVKLCLLAATRDDRYAPVTAAEVDDLKINIWLITEQKEVHSFDQIDLIQSGVRIVHPQGEATVLPYFTKQHAEDPERVLSELQSKSGLSPQQMKECRHYTIQTKRINFGTFDFSVPQVLRGHGNDWPALQKWTPSFFSERFGNLELPVRQFERPGLGLHPLTKVMKLKDYLSYWSTVGSEPPDEILYLANWLYEKDASILNEDFELPAPFQNDLFHLLPQNFQYPRRWLFFGHHHCSTPAHVDTLNTSAWLAMIYGRKKAKMISPRFSEHFPNLLDLDSSESLSYCAANGIPILEEVIGPGDFLFIPGGWLHHITSLEPNLLLTGNILDEQTVQGFLEQIAEKSKKTDLIQTVMTQVRRRLEASYDF